jgi:hypothetical protein
MRLEEFFSDISGILTKDRQTSSAQSAPNPNAIGRGNMVNNWHQAAEHQEF